MYEIYSDLLVRAFNESCVANKTSCIAPLKCTGGYCLCSSMGKTTDEKNPLLFWVKYRWFLLIIC
jgi:hypothetical protein